MNQQRPFNLVLLAFSPPTLTSKIMTLGWGTLFLDEVRQKSGEKRFASPR
jgi:hypothetical protein